MPLTEFQSLVARLLAPNRSEDSYLAGGAALHLAPNSQRYSNDLDYFNDSELRVSTAFTTDRTTLEAEGYHVEATMQQPGFVRAMVTKGSESTKVEWAHDSAWRFLPTILSTIVGYQLHPIDLAINKLLALVGRDEPRDFLDIMYIQETTLSLGALCWAAAGKDPGFSPLSLLSLLRRRGKFRPEDFARLRLLEQPDLMLMKTQWLAALEGAERFIAARDPQQAGCLYYSTTLSRFVSDFEEGDATVSPHYGRPGGVIPRF